MSTKEVKKGRAVEWSFGESSGGYEQIGVRFDIVDAEGHPTNDSETWYGTFSDAAWSYTADALKACGWDGKSLETLDGMGSRDVQLVIVEEEYQGEIQRKVKYINAGTGVAMKKPLGDEQKRQFFARMQQRMSGGRPPTPAPKKPVDDGDIPF